MKILNITAATLQEENMGLLDFLGRKKGKDVEADITLKKQLQEREISVNELVPLSSSKVPPKLCEFAKQFEDKSQRFKKSGAAENRTQLMFLGYALDFVDFAREKFGISLELQESDVYKVESIADKANKALLKGHLDKEEIINFAKPMAGYLGLLIMIHKGGEWVEKADSIPDAGPAIKRGTEYNFVLSKAYRRIQNGAEDNLLHFYQNISYE